MRMTGSQDEVLYDDADEYQYDVAQYPSYFETAGAALSIGNSSYQSYLMPESELELTDNEQVWQAYTVPEICVPPGGLTMHLALPGVPAGWGFSGTYETPNESITSNFVSA
jgi:hypothetical protein